jgi:hypothetical protein
MTLVSIRAMFMAVGLGRILRPGHFACTAISMLGIRAIKQLRDRGRWRKHNRPCSLWGQARPQRTLRERTDKTIRIDGGRRIRHGRIWSTWIKSVGRRKERKQSSGLNPQSFETTYSLWQPYSRSHTAALLSHTPPEPNVDPKIVSVVVSMQ